MNAQWAKEREALRGNARSAIEKLKEMKTDHQKELDDLGVDR